MRTPRPLLLYSVNTRLAYMIARKYYADRHYVWCSPAFEPNGLDNATPPSSSPKYIYEELKSAVNGGDKHSAKIASARVGLGNGAKAQRLAGAITRKQEHGILDIIQSAPISEFEPLLYIIPYMGVEKMLIEPPFGDKAHPFSDEWIVKNLPRSAFDVIVF